MNSKELIEINNKKRKKLTAENLAYYENMLVYIRLSHDKAEQETEEILSELLDHLLDAQAEGKTAAEIFGDKPRQYADEIIGELPGIVTKKRILMFIMGILYFMAVFSFLHGLLNAIFYYAFGLGSVYREIYMGSAALKFFISLPLLLGLYYLVIQYLRWSCFQQINKIAEFLIFWVFGILSVGLFLAVLYFVPDFGLKFELPFYFFLLMGCILFLTAQKVKNMV
ncbi:MAG: DUF1129 family protein [Peptococcaceae bacterium]|nr:DUF1129 family protein [Peptococcaceae bacterium]